MIAGIEGGGTKFVCAVAETPERIVARATVPTTTPAETLGAAAAFLAQHDVRALGIASFGPLGVDPARADFGRLLATPKARWSGVDLVAGLGAQGLPVAVETDVIGAALGEQAYGAGRGARDLVYVTVGTGIGVGVLAGGAPLHGVLHPEAGHVRVPRAPGDDFAGICPYHGDCLEGLASGPALAARAGRPAEALADDDALWPLFVHDLAAGLANLILTLVPERVVLGGGVLGRAHLWPPLRAAVAAQLAGYLPTQRTGPWDAYLVPPALGARAGVTGALVLAAGLVTGR
jgi:fructokinase